MMSGMFPEGLKPEDPRPPKGGWCPGDYVGMTCRVCGCQFSGDKRAYECAECAYANPSQNRPPSYWYCQTCDQKLDGEEVTPEELHDPVYGGCGFKVESRSGTPNRPPSCDLPPEHYDQHKGIKPCPICGHDKVGWGAGDIYINEFVNDEVAVQCDHCGVQVNDRTYRESKGAAVKAWNSIPRRSEVAELLRLVHKFAEFHECENLGMSNSYQQMMIYAAKLRKELKL